MAPSLTLFYFSCLWCCRKCQCFHPVFSAMDNPSFSLFSFYSSSYLSHFQNSLLFMYCGACYKNMILFILCSVVFSSSHTTCIFKHLAGLFCNVKYIMFLHRLMWYSQQGQALYCVPCNISNHGMQATARNLCLPLALHSQNIVNNVKIITISWWLCSTTLLLCCLTYLRHAKRHFRLSTSA